VKPNPGLWPRFHSNIVTVWHQEVYLLVPLSVPEIYEEVIQGSSPDPIMNGVSGWHVEAFSRNLIRKGFTEGLPEQLL
jgi:hypothetical protein